MTSNPTLDDEITSINSIYGDSTLLPLPANDTTPNTTNATHLLLTLPSHPTIRLLLSFPPTYPLHPPTILSPHSTGPSLPKGSGAAAQRALTATLAAHFRAGSCVVYDLVEECAAGLDAALSELRPASAAAAGSADGDAPAPAPDDFPPPAWTVGDPVSSKKSVFLGRAAPASSPAHARACVRALVAADRRAARATHNVAAWRAGGEGDGEEGHDDDGEQGAGLRVLAVLRAARAAGVVVVVSRWFGGVKLGPERFRLFNAAARDALVRGGWVGEAGGRGGGGGGGGGGGDAVEGEDGEGRGRGGR